MPVNPVSNFSSVEYVGAIEEYFENMLENASQTELEKHVENLLKQPKTPKVKEALAQAFFLLLAMQLTVKEALVEYMNGKKPKGIQRQLGQGLLFGYIYRLQEQLGVQFPVQLEFNLKTFYEAIHSDGTWLQPFVTELIRLIESEQFSPILDNAAKIFDARQQLRFISSFVFFKSEGSFRLGINFGLKLNNQFLNSIEKFDIEVQKKSFKMIENDIIRDFNLFNRHLKLFSEEKQKEFVLNYKQNIEKSISIMKNIGQDYSKHEQVLNRIEEMQKSKEVSENSGAAA